MKFLQAHIIESSTTVILNYGAIGALLLLSIVALVWMGRYFVRQSEKRDQKFEISFNILRTQMQKYIDEDRKEMIRVIADNTQVIREFTASQEDLRREIHAFKK